MREAVALCALILLLAAGCVTTGRDFPVTPVKRIVSGQTTTTEVRVTFGEPYLKVFQKDKQTWTYYRVLYALPNRVRSKELNIVFDARGVVEDFSYSTNYPDSK